MSDTPDPNDAAQPAEESESTESPQPQDGFGALPQPAEPAPVPKGLMLFFAATRAYSYPASIVPVLLGTALATRGYGGSGQFDLVNFLLTLAGAMLAHSGGNAINDYFDFVSGVDSLPEHGSGVITRGWLTPHQMKTLGIRLLLGGALCGYLILMRTPDAATVVVPLALIGLVCAALYTSIMKRVALGDLTIMTAFGIGLTLGAYAVQTPLRNGEQVGLIALLSLPVSLLVDAILHANNMRDAQNDSAKGLKTLASLLGPEGSQSFQALLVFGPVALVTAFVGIHLLPLTSLLTLLALPLLIKAYRTGSVELTAQTHLVFGALYALSILLMPHP